MLLALPAPAQVRRQQTPATPPPPAPASDLASISQEALGWLKDLIRINTTNPPGNELAAAKYLAGIFEKEGIPAEVLESTPGRGAIVARLISSPVPNPSRALLLMAHLDVVGVDRSKWTADPFGGIIKDGYLYGRGTIDDKGMVAANLAVMVALKRSNAHIYRDIIFLAEGDEEQGGDAGMKFVVEKYWNKIAAGYALNEEGRAMVKDGKVQYVGIQATEKVPVTVDIIASGPSGHASVPRPENALVRLAAAITKIAAYQPPAQINSVTRAYFEGLSKVEDEETSKWMRVIDTPDRGDHAIRWLSEHNPVWNSMLHDTIAPTMLQAGIRVNVIPSEARGTLNIRLLPGNLADPLLAKFRELANDPQVRFEIRDATPLTAPASSLQTDLYQAIGKAATQEFPGAEVLPMMSTGATDSQPLRLRSVQAYGLLPFPLTQEDILRMHADDERIPLDAFRKGIEFLYRVVDDFAITH